MKRLIACAAAALIIAATGGGTAIEFVLESTENFAPPKVVQTEQCGTIPPEEKHSPIRTEAKTADGSFAYKMDAYMPRDKNYMFSPLSVKTALALTANGAEGKTKQEILDTLGIDDLDKFNAYTKQFIENGESNDKVELKISDSIWLNTEELPGVEFGDEFTAKAKEYYKAEAGTVKYNDAVEKINSWCSEKTNGRIKEMIDDPDFLAALVNAVYFKGDWETAFDESATQKQEFTDRNGSKKDIDFMRKTADFGYYEDKDVKIVRMPYADGKTVMYAVLSGDKRIDISKYTDKLSTQKVRVEMPKFRTEYKCSLNDILASMGINDAFSPNAASFFGMFKSYGSDNTFYIDEVLHKAFIEVNESGTEAAAVTAVMMRKCSTAVDTPHDIKQFTADKPFGYYIMDTETDEILFMGEYAYAE